MRNKSKENQRIHFSFCSKFQFLSLIYGDDDGKSFRLDIMSAMARGGTAKKIKKELFNDKFHRENVSNKFVCRQ